MNEFSKSIIQLCTVIVFWSWKQLTFFPNNVLFSIKVKCSKVRCLKRGKAQILARLSHENSMQMHLALINKHFSRTTFHILISIASFWDLHTLNFIVHDKSAFESFPSKSSSIIKVLSSNRATSNFYSSVLFAFCWELLCIKKVFIPKSNIASAQKSL